MSLSRLQILEIKKRRNEGQTNEQIAVDLGVTTVTVARWVKKLREAGHEVKRFTRGRKAMEL